MKAVIQRVKSASVTVEGKRISEIGPGIMTLLCVVDGDSEENARKMVDKICGLRIFPDREGKMNRSLLDVQGEHLIVSQFTLAGDCRKGRRPSFIGAAKPEEGQRLYELALQESRDLGVKTQGGQFQAMMDVELVNDGPVTLILEF